MERSNKRQILVESVHYRMPGTSGGDVSNNPNQWFADKFPAATEQYGPAFMEGAWADDNGLNRFIPTYMNEDFFGALLGGDSRIGIRVVYYPPEDAFYFYDYMVDAYCPTTEEKLKLLLSNYLIRCSQECGALVDITNLVVRFREDLCLTSIISKSKAALQTERCFFCQRRFENRIDWPV